MKAIATAFILASAVMVFFGTWVSACGGALACVLAFLMGGEANAAYMRQQAIKQLHRDKLEDTFR